MKSVVLKLTRVLLTVGCLIVFGSVPAYANDELAAVAQAGNRAARQAIRTLSARTKVEMVFPREQVLSVTDYFRVGDEVRIRSASDNRPTGMDILVQHDEMRAVMRSQSRQGGAIRVEASRKSPTSNRGFHDAWHEMLLDHTDAAGKFVTYEDLFRLGTPGPARRQSLNGVDYVTILIKFRDVRDREVSPTLWHDVSRNYLVGRREFRLTHVPVTSVAEITDWAEPEPGVFVPTRCTRTILEEEKVVEHQIATLTDLVVNKPISATTMRLPGIPSGTTLHDEIRGITGQVDSNWKPIGSQAPLKQITVNQSSPELSAPTQLPGRQSTTEPTATWVWVVGLFGLLVVVSVGILAYRRLRADRL